MKSSRETQMESELEKLGQKFDSIINDIKSKEAEIQQLEEDIEMLNTNPRRETISSENYTDGHQYDSETSNKLYSQYKSMIKNYDGDKKFFIVLYEDVKTEEKNVLQLEKQLTRIHEKLETGMKSIDRETKRKDKLIAIKEKCDFFRFKYEKLYYDNEKLKELLTAILNHSKTVEKTLCSAETDDLIKKFNDMIRERQQYDLEQLLVFKDIDEILEEQYNIINGSNLN